jgi:hypothetical protein
MEILIVLSVLGIAGIFAGHRYQRNQMRLDYAEYMANRIVFDTSEMNSDE